MKARERLEGLTHAQRRIHIKVDRVAELTEIATKITSTMSDMPRGAYNPRKREVALTALIDLKAELSGQIIEMVAEEKFIRGVIENIEDATAKEILERHYINGENWTDIADAIGVTPRQIYRLRDNAILQVENYLKEVGN